MYFLLIKYFYTEINKDFCFICLISIYVVTENQLIITIIRRDV